ncbi:MAG: type II secretion system protein GspG [Planctomycetota bacterium]
MILGPGQHACRKTPGANGSGQRAFTLVELLIVIAILTIIVSIAVPYYASAIEQARVTRAIAEIRNIATEIEMYHLRTGDYPLSREELLALGGGEPNVGQLLRHRDYTDPWGNGYQYLNIKAQDSMRRVRKDMNLVPINTFFDLYSKGPNGLSLPPLSMPQSRDDIIYANDGDFIGRASDY